MENYNNMAILQSKLSHRPFLGNGFYYYITFIVLLYNMYVDLFFARNRFFSKTCSSLDRKGHVFK